MFGNQRFVWNQLLKMLNKRHQNNPQLKFPHQYTLNILLPLLKREYSFLSVSLSQALQLSVENLHLAFVRFFKQTSRYPRFHSRRRSYQSFTGKQGCLVVGKHYVKLPKLGYLKVSNTACIQHHLIKRFTVSVNGTGKYFLAVNYECDNQTLPTTGQAIGIDLNTSELATLSDGIHIPTLNLKSLERQLRLEQRKLSRRNVRAKIEIAHDKLIHPDNVRELTDFPNYQRQKQRVTRIHEKIRNKRQDYLQKLTTWLVRHYDTIVIEDLKVSNMVRNHHLARKIEHQSWYEFRRELTYKCQWYGKQLVVVNPRNTSRVCSTCGKKNQAFDQLDQNTWLSVREWTCPSCGTHHDRDVNAANNILNKGLVQMTN